MVRVRVEQPRRAEWWVRQASRIFPGVRPCPEHWTARQRAERIAAMLAACAPEADGPLLERVFFGAAQAG